MSSLPGPFNAIVYAQFNIQGRWRRLLGFAGAYTVLIAGAIFLSTMGDDRYHRNNYEGWLATITGLQVMNLLIFGGYRVDSAVRGDVTSRMIESHRLMPTTPLAGILGYIFGAPLQPLLIAAANFIIGAVCCVMAGVSLDRWALANGVLLVAAIFIYSLIVQFAFIARGGFLLMVIALFIITATGVNQAILIVPSLNVLTFPLLSASGVFAQLFSRGIGGSEMSYAYVSAIAGQLVIAMICIHVAIRRYQAAGMIGFSPTLGLLLLAAWVGLAVVDFSWPATFNYRRYGYQEDLNAPQTVVSFVTAMLLAALPIASAAKTLTHKRHTVGAAPIKRHMDSSVIWTLLASSGIICFIMMDSPLKNLDAIPCITTTFLIVMLVMIGTAAIFSWGYLVKWNPWTFAVLAVIVTWVGPVLADVVYRTMTGTSDVATAITAASPIGALSLLWSDSKINLGPGLIAQCIFPLGPLGLLLIAQKRQKRRDDNAATHNGEIHVVG